MAGINLSAGKEGLVRSRLTKRLRALDLSGFDPYVELVERIDNPAQARLVARHYALLRSGGILFVGHSQSLSGLVHGFRYVQPAVVAR